MQDDLSNAELVELNDLQTQTQCIRQRALLFTLEEDG